MTNQMTCPKCRGTMTSYERNGVHVDQCQDCRGLFLDRGELERLVDAEAAFNSPVAPAAPRDRPGYREALKPSAKRHGVADGIALSTQPVLLDLKEVKVERLMQELEGDGFGASMIRMGPGLSFTGPDPRVTGGQYYLVVNGSLELGNVQYSKWSTVFLTGEESPLEFKSGPKGLEALLLQFSKNES